jgi:molybdopterin converting factor small subunit
LIVRVKCFAGLRRYAPAGRSDFKVEIAAGAPVGQLLDQMGVPADDRTFIAVNGTRAGRDKPLFDGDLVVLFPLMEGG